MDLAAAARGDRGRKDVHKTPAREGALIFGHLKDDKTITLGGGETWLLQCRRLVEEGWVGQEVLDDTLADLSIEVCVSHFAREILDTAMIKSCLFGDAVASAVERERTRAASEGK